MEAPLMATAGGKAGAVAGVALPAIAASFVPGGQSLAGSMIVGGGLGGVEPTLKGESALQNTMLATAAGGLGYGAGNLIGKGVAKLADRATSKSIANASTDANTKLAREAGYVIPPSQSNPGVVTSTLDILAGGRPKMAQAASLKNQPVTNRLAAEELGLSADTALSKELLTTVRQQAFTKGYMPVRSAGEIVPDSAYTKALDVIESTTKGASRSFPSAAKSEIPELVNGLRVQKFDAADAVDMTQILRDTADKAYRTGDNALGKAAKDAAKALEDQLERHMSSNGMGDALKAFKEARTLMAKTHSVGKVLNDTTGDVSAKGLAAQLKAGKPLTGNLERIARTAQLPGKNVQDMAYMTPGASQLEGMVSAGGAITSSNPLYLGIPYLRAGLRNTLLSNPVQRMIPQRSYMLNGMTPQQLQVTQGALSNSGAVTGIAFPGLLNLVHR
jgi:hypothetical protein